MFLYSVLSKLLGGIYRSDALFTRLNVVFKLEKLDAHDVYRQNYA